MICFKQSILVTCIASVLVTGCAAPSGQGGSGIASNNTALRCAGFGIGGALLGAVVGGKNAAVKGALVGLAACALVEIASGRPNPRKSSISSTVATTATS